LKKEVQHEKEQRKIPSPMEMKTKFMRKLSTNLAKEILSDEGNDVIPLPSSFSPGR